MSRELLKPLIIIILLLFSIVPIGIITTVDEINKFSANQVVDLSRNLHQNRLIQQLDQNNNKISDSFPTQKQMVDSILLFKSKSLVPQSLNQIPIDYQFESIPAISATIPTNMLSTLQNLPGLVLIEENAPLVPRMAYSSSQFGVRGHVWDRGYMGNSSASVAIVDTGVDVSHPAIKKRILASYNVLDDNQTSTTDDVGHGTHVAGITAGLPNTSSNSYTVTKRSNFPDAGFFRIAWQMVNTPAKSVDINVTLDWDQKGTDNPNTVGGVGVIDINTGNIAECANCEYQEKDGYLSQTITIPQGDYYIGFFGDSNSAGVPFEASADLVYDGDIPFNTTNPDIDSHAGIAPKANIINLKVIDNLGNGDTETFGKAVDWLIKNKEQYNITVVNLSIGVDKVIASIDLLMRRLIDNGMLPVVAAGNAGPNSKGINSPGSAPEALTVGAVGRYNEITYYSSAGSKEANNVVKPDVVAPGGSSASTLLNFKTGYKEGFSPLVSIDANIGFNLENNDFSSQEGTSMAAPHVAGLALLMSQKLMENQNWDWSSATDPLAIKRAILSGTFEVAKIGVGREVPPRTTYEDSMKPKINRNTKDFHEGWGAVDAAGVFELLHSTINVGDTKSFKLKPEDPFGRHVKGWRFSASKDTSYGFALSVPSGLDADLLIVSADSGPLDNDGEDYGDLNVLHSSSFGEGKSEKLALQVNSDQDLFIIARSVSGHSNQNITLSIEHINNFPDIDVQQPQNGESYSESDLEILFDAKGNTVVASLDENDLGTISTGHTLKNLPNGNHTLDLVVKNPDGYSISTSIEFTINNNLSNGSDSETNNSFVSLRLWTIIGLIVVFQFRRRDQ